MPHGSTHQRQQRKNYILLAVLIGVVALLFTMTVVKLSLKSEQDAAVPVIVAK